MDPFGAISGIIQQGIVGHQQRRNIADQAKYNKELAQYSYGQDLAMWHRQNEYNAPVSQMQRLKDAGLNPALVYGSKGGGNAGNAQGQLPKYQQQSVDFMGRQPMVGLDKAIQGLNAFADLEIKQKQAENIQANTDNANQRTNTEVANRAINLLRYSNNTDIKNMRISDYYGKKHSVFDINKSMVQTPILATQASTQSEIERKGLIQQQTRVQKKTADLFEVVKFGALALGAGSMLSGLGKVATLAKKGSPIKGMASKLLRQVKRVSTSRSGKTKTYNTRNFWE